MVRLGRTIAGGLGQGPGPARFQGIRFRLGLWLAIALLPLLILGGFQAQSAFRTQDGERRSDLQLAAARSAANANMNARNDATASAAAGASCCASASTSPTPAQLPPNSP